MIQTIRQHLQEAMKEKKDIKKDILRVLLGELQKANVTDGPRADSIIRSIMNSNLETCDNTYIKGAIRLIPEIERIDAVSGSPDNVGKPITGDHGALTLRADGTYTYNIKTDDATVCSVNMANSTCMLRCS